MGIEGTVVYPTFENVRNKMDSTNTITVDRDHYYELLERERWLCALEAAGIDNTDAYSLALDILEEWEKEDEN